MIFNDVCILGGHESASQHLLLCGRSASDDFYP